MGNRNSLVTNSSTEHSFCFWVGQKPQFETPIPSCWEELIDWTQDASRVLQIFRRRQKLYDDGKEDFCDETQFIPYVAEEKSEEVYSLASLSMIDRAGFYAENVSQGLSVLWYE
jgi:hypothetical protein